MIRKWLVVGIILLFVSISFQPIIAEETVSVEKISNYENINFEQAKEYLFQTLVDIFNNPEVKQFLNDHKKDLVTNNNNNYGFRNAFQKIYRKNPRLVKSILFTRPKMTSGYLDKSYNNGIELIDILGEEESLDIVESVRITNPELFKRLNNIIENNEELSNRIIAFRKINTEFEPIPPKPICWILLAIALPTAILTVTFEYTYFILRMFGLGRISKILTEFFSLIFLSILYIGDDVYSCWEIPIPTYP